MGYNLFNKNKGVKAEPIKRSSDTVACYDGSYCPSVKEQFDMFIKAGETLSYIRQKTWDDLHNLPDADPDVLASSLDTQQEPDLYDVQKASEEFNEIMATRASQKVNNDVSSKTAPQPAESNSQSAGKPLADDPVSNQEQN